MQLWRTRPGLLVVRCAALRAGLSQLWLSTAVHCRCCVWVAKGSRQRGAQRLLCRVQRGIETVADVMTKGKIHCVREWTPIDNGELQKPSEKLVPAGSGTGCVSLSDTVQARFCYL